MCEVLDRAEAKGARAERETIIWTMHEEGAGADLIARLLRLDLSTVQEVLARKARV